MLTPVPWRTVRPDDGPETHVFRHGKTIVADVTGATMAVAYTDYGTDERARSNAEFIVRAVNAHDDLVKALRWFLEPTPAGESALLWSEKMTAARAALATAEGEPVSERV